MRYPQNVFWITRPGGGGLADARFFTRHGLQSLYAPLTRIQPTEHLYRHLQAALTQHTALAFTSPNAVRAVHACLPPETVKHLTVFTAGAVTFATARRAGFKCVHNCGSGGENIIRAVIQYGSPPLIHCSGADIRTDIAAELRQSGVHAQRIITYRAEAAPVSCRHVRLLEAGKIQGVLFCSVKAALLWKKHLLSHEPVAIKRKPAYYCLSHAISAACPPRLSGVYVPPVPYPAVLREAIVRREHLNTRLLAASYERP